MNRRFRSPFHCRIPRVNRALATGRQANPRRPGKSRILMARWTTSRALLVGAVLLAPPVMEPALAQSGQPNPLADFFGSIFGNPPPRPPADVRGPPSSRQQPPPYYSGGRDTPPSQPLPAPMSLPPS